MRFEKERKQICTYGRMLADSGLTPGTSGNLSIYDAASQTVLITPSGIPYHELQPEQIVEMDLDGNVTAGIYKPSSEYHLHTLLYKNKPKAKAIIHTHSFYCTALGVLDKTLKPVHYTLADAGTSEVFLAPYKLMGTRELAEECVKAIQDSKAVLMKNHGITAYGKDLGDAFGVVRNCEWCAKLQLLCESAGTPSYLSQAEMDEVIVAFDHYGQAETLQ